MELDMQGSATLIGNADCEARCCFAHKLPAGLLLLAIALVPAIAAAQPAQKWHTGVDFQRQLNSPISLHSTGTPLRDQLNNLAETQQVAIWLDRRVDPNQRVAIEVTRVPLRQALGTIADDRALGVSQLDAALYIGPAEQAAQLRTVAALAVDNTSRLAPATRRKLRAKAAWNWPLLSEPRALLGELQAELGIPIRGSERIPHDLWPAVDLPPLSLHDRLTLVLYGFGLTYRAAATGEALELTPIEPPVRLVRDYPAPRTGTNEAHIVRLKEVAPAAEYKTGGGKVWVRGRWEDHQRIAAVYAGRSPARNTSVEPPVSGGVDVYTLTIEDAKIGPLMRQLGQRLEMTIEFDEAAIAAAGLSLDKTVSFQVTGVRLPELLGAALKPAGLTYQQQETTIRVLPDAAP